MARGKKTLYIPPDFDIHTEEWAQFINGIPGRTYDGCEVTADENGNVQIVSAWAKTGDTRVEYTAVQKSEMQAYAASMAAGNVASINNAKAG